MNDELFAAKQEASAANARLALIQHAHSRLEAAIRGEDQEPLLASGPLQEVCRWAAVVKDAEPQVGVIAVVFLPDGTHKLWFLPQSEADAADSALAGVHARP